MNPLPRVLGLALLLILIALSILLFATRPSVRANREPTRASDTPARLADFSHRLALPLSLTAVVLTTALLASLALPRPRSSDSHAPFNPDLTRTEVGALAKLAESSVAQSRELAHERDVRQRAEADALLTQQLLNRSLQEKIRLGRDLHDGIIQSLYAAGLTLESARPLVASDPAEAEARITRTRENLNHCIRDIRAHIAGLAPENLTSADFAPALRAIADELAATRAIEFNFQIDETAVRLLSPAQSIELLQIAREAFSNALRHGAASKISIHLSSTPAALDLAIHDNGTGFDPSAARTGHGLSNMRARATQLGATLHLESSSTTGTRLSLTLPSPSCS
jgi:Signal transduction histidine kinase